MRELGRFLIAMRQNCEKSLTLQDCLTPNLFDNIIKSTKQIAGYDSKTDLFGAPSLVLKIELANQRIFLTTFLNSPIEAPQEEIASSLSKVEN
ncbi:hypothetical protein ACI65C_013770 [Semiaphis heraclei]